MRRSRQTAAERVLALAALLSIAFGGSTARAQSDPFALPSGVTARSVSAQAGPGLSEIAVDGETRVRLVDLAWQNGVLTIDAEAARAAGLPVPEGARGKVPLDSLKVAKWNFDPRRQRLEVQLLRKSDRGNLIDLSRAPRQDGVSAPLTALRIDYDLTGTLAKGRSGVGGYADVAIVRGNTSFSSGFQFTSSPAAGSSAFTRLDTTLEVQLPRSGLTVTAGDMISAGGQSQRALRLGGLRIGSDYSLRPDLVTSPLPAFTGQVSVPTGVEVITGDQRYKLGDIEPGEFTVRNVPANNGRGEVSVIVRDSLGREVIQDTRFYVSRALLAPGLREFAVNIGYVRRRYGVRSNDYGPLAGSAFYRRGLSPRLTVEGTAEWTPGLINVGARGDLVLGGVAMVTAEFRFSRDSDAGLSGTLVHFGVESVGRGFSARVAATIPSANYRDVAAKNGDPDRPREYLGQISYNLKGSTQFQLTASRQVRQADPRYPFLEPRVDMVTGSFRTQLRPRVDFFVNAGYRQGNTRSVTAWAGISVQLGGGRSAQASASGGSANPFTANAGFYRHASEAQPIGYGAEAMTGPNTRLAGTLTYRSPIGRFETQAEYVGGAFGLRGNARGTLLMAGGKVFARNQSGGSYALVKTGDVNGVTVLRENRPAGLTSGKGLLLVENIPAQVPLTFDVDADKLPNDALARATKVRIIVPRRAVGLVALDVVRFRPQLMRVTDPQGVNLPTGTILIARPSGERLMVGFDGIVEFNGAGRDLELEQPLEAGAVCVFNLRLRDAPVPNGPIPSAACSIRLPVQIVDEDRDRGKGQGRGKGKDRRGARR